MNLIYLAAIWCYRLPPFQWLLHHMPWRKRCHCWTDGTTCSDHMLAAAKSGQSLATIKRICGATSIFVLCLMMVGAMACKGSNSSSSGSLSSIGISGSGGAVISVPVYKGDSPPSEGGAGTWISAGFGGKSFWWPIAGAGAGITLSKVVQGIMKKGLGAGQGSSATLANDPCQGKNSEYKIARWPGTAPKGAKPNFGLNLTCGQLRQLFNRHGVPARLKYIYECIAGILANGRTTYGNFGPRGGSLGGGGKGAFRIGYDGGLGHPGYWVTTTATGQVMEMGLKEGWGQCARDYGGG